MMWQTRNRVRRTREGLRLESLEDRRLLALSAELVADLAPSGIGSAPRSFTEWNGQLYFEHSRGFKRVLSAYDGTQVVDISQDAFPLFQTTQMYATDDALYIVGSRSDDFDDPERMTLWKFDGQQTEPVEMCENETCEPIFAPSNLTEFAGAIYLLASDHHAPVPESNKLLIKLENGVANSVTVVPGLETLEPRGQLQVYDDNLIVAADALLELNADSLVPLSAPGHADFSRPRELTVLGDQLLFSAQAPWDAKSGVTTGRKWKRFRRSIPRSAKRTRMPIPGS